VFDHVTIRASDRAASERFYRTVLPTLGIEPTHVGEDFVEWDDFSLAQATADRSPTRRLHIGFVAPSRAEVEAFWSAGTDAGYRDDGAPGPRPQYRDDYYGAFLLDPDGNSAEAVHHGALRRGGNVDHLWIRVADVAAARAFYATIAPHAGLRPGAGDRPGHAHVAGESGSFSLVPGEPTEHVHLAFPADDDATVDAFHRAATDAGHRDNGAPGERAVYHPGYYAAFVLDPDGNNVEVVNHNRR
jgi:catechol 2,3-dioxygenase-like lactoylglutathione lyase family enzyme